MSNFKSTYNQFKKYNSKPVIIKKEFVIKDNDFPDLASQLDNSNISNKNNSKNNNVMSFASLLKKVETPDIVKYDDDEIIPNIYNYTLPAHPMLDGRPGVDQYIYTNSFTFTTYSNF